MKKILIIGANGFTGRQILNDLSVHTQYKVTGCSLHPDILPNDAGKYRFIETDIRNEADIKRLFEEVQPDVVINCSALSVPDYCETHHEEAYLTNVTAVSQLAVFCEEYKSRFIHLSTDFVFDEKINEDAGLLYTEEDIPAPVNYYGYTKWKGEEKVAETCSSYAIVRVAIVYGRALPGQHGNIVQLDVLSNAVHHPIRLQHKSVSAIDRIRHGFLVRLSNGIFHICGVECMSIAEIAYQVADYMGLDHSLIHPVTTEEMNETTPRPRFSGMSIDKARTMLGYKPQKLKEVLANWEHL